MAKYAARTEVPADRSRAEIEKILTRYGANGFMYGWAEQNAVVMFEMAARRIKFVLPLPDKSDPDIARDYRGYIRSDSAQQKAYDQAVRQRWRALALVIKAKLESVESGVTVFEDEFMAHIVLPNGATVGEFMQPQIANAYETGQMPPLLPRPEK